MDKKRFGQYVTFDKKPDDDKGKAEYVKREKVIKGLQEIVDDNWMKTHADWHVSVCSDALALLKEDCHNCKLECLLQKYDQLKEKYDELLKEQETQKFFVDESGKITPLPVVVRCKDCANGEVCTQSWDGVQYVECHAHEEEGYDHEDGHPLDWFCADGERKESR